jgi:hypothetical protein
VCCTKFFLINLYFTVNHDTCVFPSAVLAGPLITFPVEEKREPWHGQSNDFSELFHVTIQPKCVHTAEYACSCPLW